MNRTSKFLQLAKEQALLSSMKPQIGAVLVRGNRIIKLGYNTPGKAKLVGTWSRHAEIRATINKNAEQGTVYIYRQHGTLGTPLNAKPCNYCQKWLKYINISNVVYTIPEYPYYEIMEF